MCFVSSLNLAAFSGDTEKTSPPWGHVVTSQADELDLSLLPHPPLQLCLRSLHPAPGSSHEGSRGEEEARQTDGLLKSQSGAGREPGPASCAARGSVPPLSLCTGCSLCLALGSPAAQGPVCHRLRRVSSDLPVSPSTGGFDDNSTISYPLPSTDYAVSFTCYSQVAWGAGSFLCDAQIRKLRLREAR